MQLQVRLWCLQRKLEEARSEALRAADVFEKLGDTGNMENCRRFLRQIAAEMDDPVISDESDFNGKLPGTDLLPTPTNFSFSARGTG